MTPRTDIDTRLAHRHACCCLVCLLSTGVPARSRAALSAKGAAR